MCSVTEMEKMFSTADVFNQDLSGWDVEKVTEMSFMFEDAEAFNQNLSSWKIPANPDPNDCGARACEDFATGSGCPMLSWGIYGDKPSCGLQAVLSTTYQLNDLLIHFRAL